MKNVPVQAICTGEIFYRKNSMNSIVRVGDGDGLYGEQWNLSGVYCPHGRRLFSFIDLFPPYFIKLCQNIDPKTPLKCDFSI
jgi:hypothetical protein